MAAATAKETATTQRGGRCISGAERPPHRTIGALAYRIASVAGRAAFW